MCCRFSNTILKDIVFIVFCWFRVNNNPSWYLLVWSQQWKHQNNVWNLFRVNNKDTRTTSWCCFDAFVVNFEHFTHCPGVSIVDFEPENAGWIEALIFLSDFFFFFFFFLIVYIQDKEILALFLLKITNSGQTLLKEERIVEKVVFLLL